MTSRSFFTLFPLLTLTLFGLHLLIASFQSMWPFDKILIYDIIVMAVFLLASLTMIPAFKGKKENFVMRFMALTTLQFLAGMSILLYIIYSHMESFKMVALNTLSFFVAILFLQSILFLLAIRK